MDSHQILRALDGAGFEVTVQARTNDFSVRPRDPNRLREVEMFLRREYPGHEVLMTATSVFVGKALPDPEARVKALRKKHGKSILVDYDGDDATYIAEEMGERGVWAVVRFDRQNNVYRIDGRDAPKLAQELVRRGGRIVR